MAGEQIIELDLGRDLLESPDPPRRRSGPLRLTGFVLVLALCLASLGAARRPPAPPFTHLGFVLRPSSSSPMTNPTDLVLVGGMLLARQGSGLIAFEPTGARRWAVRFDDGDLGSRSYRMWQGHLLVARNTLIRFSDGAYGGMSAVDTVAFDPATGAQQWQVDGAVRQVGDLVVVDDGVHPKLIYRSLPSDLLWTVPPSLASTVDAKGRAVFAVTEEGVLTEYDLRTGAVRGSGTVEVPHLTRSPGDELRSEEISIEVFNDLILLRAQPILTFEQERSQIRVYDRATLLPATTDLSGLDFVVNCGPVVCALRGEQLSILDGDDLTELWRAPQGQFPFWDGSMLVVGGQFAESYLRVLDPRTGRILITLDEWKAVAQWDPSSGQTWLTNAMGSGHTKVAVLEPSGLRTLGTLPMRLTDCQTDGRLLAGVAPDGRIEVWRANVG